MHADIPAGTQSCNNVNSTLIQHQHEPTLNRLFQQCVLTGIGYAVRFDLGVIFLCYIYHVSRARLRSACASTQSDQSLHCPPKDALDPWLPTVPCVDSDQTARMSIRQAHTQSWKKRCALAYLTLFTVVVPQCQSWDRLLL